MDFIFIECWQFLILSNVKKQSCVTNISTTTMLYSNTTGIQIIFLPQFVSWKSYFIQQLVSSYWYVKWEWLQ